MQRTVIKISYKINNNIMTQVEVLSKELKELVESFNNEMHAFAVEHSKTNKGDFFTFQKKMEELENQPKYKRIDELKLQILELSPIGKTTPIDPEFSDVYTLTDFIECVKLGGFIDYDGFGILMINETEETELRISPSQILQMLKDNAVMRPEITHVNWYNR